MSREPCNRHGASRPRAGGVTVSRWPPAHDDAGRVLLLSLAFGVLLLLVVTVVVSASAVHLERKRLYALADAVALGAAQAIDLDSFYTGAAPSPQDGAVLFLTDGDVREAVLAQLAATPETADGFTDLQVVDASSPDGRSARVVLAASAQIPLVSQVTRPWGDGVRIVVESTARAW